jgi:hypothetical protein
MRQSFMMSRISATPVMFVASCVISSPSPFLSSFLPNARALASAASCRKSSHRAGRLAAPARTGGTSPATPLRSCDLGAITYRDMTIDPRRAADHHAVSDCGASGDPNLGNEHAMTPYAHIVANLNQIVDLGAFADHGVIERAAIDGGVGTDFDMVLNDHTADLRDLLNPLGPGA